MEAEAKAEAARIRQEMAAREKADRDAANWQESAKSARDAAERHTKATAAHIKSVLQKRDRERPARPEMAGCSEQSIKKCAELPTASSAIGRTLLKWGQMSGATALMALGVLLVAAYLLALVGSALTVVIASIILGVIKVMEFL